eukprot:scaffold1669_cov129-Cylindrotheca_fusiformis.AAC.34
MSAGQRRIQQHYTSETKDETEASEQANLVDSTSDRISSGRARAGALFVQVYERGPKGGISPGKVLFEWTKELVGTIQADKSGTSSSKAALDLLEAIKFALTVGPVDWKEEFVIDVVQILQTHSVS